MKFEKRPLIPLEVVGLSGQEARGGDQGGRRADENCLRFETEGSETIGLIHEQSVPCN
jgi:hypothetical protein